MRIKERIIRTSLIAVVSLILVFTLSCFSKIKNDKHVLFKTNIANDATPAVLKEILKAKEQSISKIKFEKGTYHFYPDKAYEKYVYISNHCDVMTNLAFPIEGMNNLTIDGQGSTFIFHGVMIPFLVEESKKITIKNITIDWADSFHSEGLIISNDKINRTFDMKISNEYPYEIRNGQIFFIKPYYEHSLGQSILFDPKRKAIAYNTKAYTGISTKTKNKTRSNLENIVYKYEYDKRAPEFKNIGIENNLRVEELKPGVVRVYNHRKEMPPVGMILVMKGEQGFNRTSPALRVAHTKGLHCENVNIHHAGGMGIIAENSSDIILDNFNVTPSNGRMVSTTADATHFVGCRGKVVLKNCTFKNQLDDAANVHGTYQKIIDILGENKIGVRMMHHQQKGFAIGEPNDKLGLVRLETSFFPFGLLTIKNIEYVNSRYQIITFNEKLPENIKKGDLVENLDAYPELLVQNCKISNNRARGLLISNPLKTVIENNFFSTEMEAILIPVESSHWYESGNAANVIIRDNVFQDCQHGGLNRGVIRFVTDDDNENIAFKNIKIQDNQFNQFDNLILEIANTEGLDFSGNKITNSAAFPQLYPQNSAINIKSSKTLKFTNNEYLGKANQTIKNDNTLSKYEFN